MHTNCGVVVLVGVLSAVPAFAQRVETETRQQLATAMTAAVGTPDARGLVPTALSEARTAVMQASAAARATDLATIQADAGGVLHAIDPALTKGGPGLGYGVRPATLALLQQLTALRAADTKADVAQTVPNAITAAEHVIRWCDAAVTTAQALLGVTRVEDAAPLVEQLALVTRQIAAGTDTSKTRHPIPAASDGGLLYLQLQLQQLKVGRDAVAARAGTVPRPVPISEQPRPPIPSGPSAPATAPTSAPAATSFPTVSR